MHNINSNELKLQLTFIKNFTKMRVDFSINIHQKVNTIGELNT